LGTGSGNQIMSTYTESAAVSEDPQMLVDHINVLLLHGSMSTDLQGWLVEAIESIPIEQGEGAPASRLRRAKLAVYLAMASPEYNVLK